MKKNLSLGLLLSAVCCCSVWTPLLAGTFFTDFNSGIPPSTIFNGTAVIAETGGVNGTGALQLTDARNAQTGSFLIAPLDGDSLVSSFIAQFSARIGGGTGADGFCFCLLPQAPDAPFAEKGVGPGLTISFDTYQETGQGPPGIRVLYDGGLIREMSIPNLRGDDFADVMVKLDPDGTLDLTYNQAQIFFNLPTPATNSGRHFAFGARTGGLNDKHLIDDLSITTQSSPGAFVSRFGPQGRHVEASAPIEIQLRDFVTTVSRDSIRLILDGAEVTPGITKRGDETLVRFQPQTPFERGSSHIVAVKFADDGTPAATNTFSYTFTVGTRVGSDNLEPGLWAEYFDFGPWSVYLTNINASLEGKAPEWRQLEETVDLGKNAARPFPNSLADYFYGRWIGKIKIPKDDAYTFYLGSDDGARLLIDDKVAVDNDGIHSPREKSGTLTLTAGDHDLRVEFFQGIGDAHCQLSWSAPGLDKEIVPASALFHKSATGEDSGLWGEYFSLDPEMFAFPNVQVALRDKTPLVQRVDKTVNFEPASKSFPGPELTVHFYVEWNGKLRIPEDSACTFFLQSDDGSRLFIDGKLLVDNGGIHGMKESSAGLLLAGGEHNLRLQYYQSAGTAACKLSWIRAGMPREIIPETFLFHESRSIGSPPVAAPSN